MCARSSPVRTWLHGRKLTLQEGQPHQKGQHLAIVYMSRAIPGAMPSRRITAVARQNNMAFFLSCPVNSISISGMLTPSHLLGQKVKPRWPPTEGNFERQFQSSSRSCTSVPVLYATLIFSFCLVRLRKHSQSWKKCTDELLLDQFYIFECLKGFIIAVA